MIDVIFVVSASERSPVVPVGPGRISISEGEASLEERTPEDPAAQADRARPRAIDIERAGHVHERRLLGVPSGRGDRRLDRPN
jgi:hypothetical protein